MQPLADVDPAQVGDGPLLDVREDDEWQAGHAPHAVHVPLHQLPARLAELPSGGPLAVVCRMGGRSSQAVEYLAAQGVPAHNVRGGMLAWAAAGLPLVAGTGTPRIA